MKSLTVLILTRDNAATLPETLASAAFADEILVLDSGSTDGTRELARAAGARVVERAFTDFAEQRNAGWAAAEGRWVLALDSDEVLDAEAAAAARAAAAREPAAGEPAAYALHRISYFLGRPLLFGGVGQDRQVRLAPRSRSRWEGRIHEHLMVDGPVANLAGLIHHHTAPTLLDRLPKLGRYALARAEEWRAQGVRTSAFALVWQPLRFFFGRVIVRQGYRDGAHGLIWWWLIATELLLAHFLLLLPEEVTRRERALLEAGPPGPARPPQAP